MSQMKERITIPVHIILPSKKYERKVMKSTKKLNDQRINEESLLWKGREGHDLGLFKVPKHVGVFEYPHELDQRLEVKCAWHVHVYDHLPQYAIFPSTLRRSWFAFVITAPISTSVPMASPPSMFAHASSLAHSVAVDSRNVKKILIGGGER